MRRLPLPPPPQKKKNKTVKKSLQCLACPAQEIEVRWSRTQSDAKCIFYCLHLQELCKVFSFSLVFGFSTFSLPRRSGPIRSEELICTWGSRQVPAAPGRNGPSRTEPSKLSQTALQLGPCSACPE